MPVHARDDMRRPAVERDRRGAPAARASDEAVPVLDAVHANALPRFGHDVYARARHRGDGGGEMPGEHDAEGLWAGDPELARKAVHGAAHGVGGEHLAVVAGEVGVREVPPSDTSTVRSCSSWRGPSRRTATSRMPDLP